MEVTTIIFGIFSFWPILGLILVCAILFGIRMLRGLPRAVPISYARRYSFDVKMGRIMQLGAILFLVSYGLLVYQGLVSSPVPEIVASMHDKFVDITEYLKSGAEVESHLLSIERAMEHAEELSKCTSETCADENRANLSPFLAYLTEEAKHAYEEDLAVNSTGANSTHDLYLGLFHIQRHIKTYTPSEHSTNVNKIVQGVVFSLIHKYIPEEILGEMGSDFNITNFRALKTVIRQARQLAHNATLAEEKFRALWNDVEHLSLALGVNKFVDSWRHDLENWGLSTDSSLILIGIFGPDLPGQITFTNCLVRHYVDSAFASEKIVRPDGAIVNGPLKWNGLTVSRFSMQVLFGRGLPYLFHQLKVVFMSCLMAYFSVGYGASAKLLNALCHEIERAHGGFDSWGFIIVRCTYLFIRSFKVISYWLATLFLITTAFGITVSFVLDFGYSIVPYFFFAYVLMVAVNHVCRLFEIQKISQTLAKGCLSAASLCLCINLAGTLALYALGEIVLQKYAFIPAFESIREWAFEFAVHHVRNHIWMLLFQFGFLLLCLWISSKRKWFKYEEYENPDYGTARKGIKPHPTWEAAKKSNRFWRTVSWILYGIGWSQPFLAVLVKNIAPFLGVTFFKELPHLGYLSFEDGAINYIWSQLDMSMLPLNQFKIE